MKNNEDDDVDLKFLESSVVKVGFPIVAASALLWFVLITVSTKLNTLEANYNQHVNDSRDLKNSVDSLKNSIDQSKNEQARTNLILQQICVNGSAARDRANCFR